MKLIHAADIHLGRRRLDGRLPDADFARAFDHVAGVAIRERADAFLLAGDLFDRAQVDPPHLRQAQTVLARLRAAAIPVIAIEGNHDKGFVHSTEPTWLDYLADEGLLTLLTTRFGPEGPRLEPWNPETRRGSFLDLGGLRFVGAGYLGAATPHKTRELVAALDPTPNHVLLLHAGPDYFVGEGGGFGRGDLAAMRARACYLALGHIHKPMVHAGWACNPGSPENCDLDESRYDRDREGRPVARGYARVELDPARREGPVSLEVCTVPRRPVVEIGFDGTPFGNKLKQGAEALAAAAAKRIREAAPPGDAAVILRLTGTVNLRRVALDAEGLGRSLAEQAGVAAVAVDLAGLNSDGEAGGTSGPGVETWSREALERAALGALVAESEFGELADAVGSGGLGDLLYDLKEAVRLGRSTEELAETLGQSAWVERLASQGASVAAPQQPPGGDPP